MFSNIFHEISALLAIATIAGAIALFLRQPLIVAFLAVGIIAGPAGLEWVASADQVDLLARLGIALLLFVVGLRLDLHVIRSVGPVALATGLGQVVFTAAVGYALALAMGYAPVPALYIAVALTFSSTIIIVKLLSDKRELDTLHGRIAVGFLIVQDIVVVLVMIGLTALGSTAASTNPIVEVVLVVLKGAGMLLVIGALMRYALPELLRRLAHSAELMLLFAIAWAVIWATLGDLLGFSKEVGAFLAGVSIASTPYRELIAARMVGLRDFLLLFFFIDLGAGLDLDALGDSLGAAAAFSIFVLVGNPLIVMAIMGWMGYRRRTGFLAGLTVAQISEFSLVLAALGLSLGHLDESAVGLVTLVGLVTISVSTYMILYSHHLFRWCGAWLSPFERRIPYAETQAQADGEPDLEVILFGLGRFGSAIARDLHERGVKLLVIDADPDRIREHAGIGYPLRYGDAEDPEFIASLPLDRVGCVVSTLRDRHVNRALLHAVLHDGRRPRVALAADSEAEAEVLRARGADIVLVPYADAARDAADRILAEPRYDMANEPGVA
ncbi:MAG: cation:proton antiporter family protein [Halofilum sp. (in: g-proteobacteria)]|nr:cation:proton antiporter family protein [Halofilum sp. (in: g-proteobacteria)]